MNHCPDSSKFNIRIRSSLIGDICEKHKTTKSIVQDILTFSPDAQKNLAIFNSMYDVITLLDSDIAELNEPTNYDHTHTHFAYHREYIVSYLLEYHMYIDGKKSTLSQKSNIDKNQLYNMFNHPFMFIGCGIIHGDITTYRNSEEYMDYVEYIKISLNRINRALELVNEKYDAMCDNKYTRPYVTIDGIRMNSKKWNNNTVGHVKEELAIDYLSKTMGWKIDQCSYHCKTICPGIVITGTPDGYIDNCIDGPGNRYYIEIKHTVNITYKHMFQIYGYWLIYQRPILLISGHTSYKDDRSKPIERSSKYTIHEYTEKSMSHDWKAYERQFIQKSKRLRKLIIPDDFESYLHFRSFMVQFNNNNICY